MLKCNMKAFSNYDYRHIIDLNIVATKYSPMIIAVEVSAINLNN